MPAGRGGTESLRDINLHIPEHSITVLFGPAGGGKSTLLRVLNRLNDLADVVFVSGKVQLDGINILAPATDVIALRRKVGMVFARPVVLPFSIRRNLTYGLELANRGFPQALLRNPALAKGLNTFDGKVTYEGVASAFNLPFTPVDEVIL